MEKQEDLVIYWEPASQPCRRSLMDTLYEFSSCIYDFTRILHVFYSYIYDHYLRNEEQGVFIIWPRPPGNKSRDQMCIIGLHDFKVSQVIFGSIWGLWVRELWEETAVSRKTEFWILWFWTSSEVRKSWNVCWPSSLFIAVFFFSFYWTNKEVVHLITWQVTFSFEGITGFFPFCNLECFYLKQEADFLLNTVKLGMF